MKKIFNWIMAISSCLVIMLLCGSHVQAAEYSISTNDSWVSGSAKDGEPNFYTFTLPSAGLVTVTCQCTQNYVGCDLMDQDLLGVYNECDLIGSETSPATRQFSVNLEAGKYCLRLRANWRGDNVYRVKAAFAPANNNETEPNDTFAAAMPLSSNTLVKGFFSADDKIDFYQFTIGAQTTVKVTVNTALDNNLDDYYLTVWNAEFIEVERDDYISSGRTYVWEKSLIPGTYYIKMASKYNDTGTYTLKWEGFNYVTSIALKKSSMTLEKGKTYNLLKSVMPASATDKKLSWTSDNTSVARVDSKGKVTAKGVGAATITAAATDGSKVQASCQIVVKPAKVKVSACRRFKDKNVYMKVKKQKNVSGIQYQLSRNKKFKGRKSSYYAGAEETVAKTGILSPNKTYYFRARMYIDYGGKRYYGGWSDVKKVRTKGRSADYGYFLWKNV